MKKAKPTKIERMLHKLFPDACRKGLIEIRRQRGRSLTEAWAKASPVEKSEVLEAAAVTAPKALRCKCSPYCWWKAKRYGALNKIAPPKKLRALYAKA